MERETFLLLVYFLNVLNMQGRARINQESRYSSGSLMWFSRALEQSRDAFQGVQQQETGLKVQMLRFQVVSNMGYADTKQWMSNCAKHLILDYIFLICRVLLHCDLFIIQCNLILINV